MKNNYNKIYMGKYFDESYEESKIDVEFKNDAVHKKIKFTMLITS